MELDRQTTIGYRLLTDLPVPPMSQFDAEVAIYAARLHMQWNRVTPEDLREIARATRTREATASLMAILRGYGPAAATATADQPEPPRTS